MDPYDKEKTREIWKRVLGEEESCDCRAFDSERLRSMIAEEKTIACAYRAAACLAKGSCREQLTRLGRDALCHSRRLETVFYLWTGQRACAMSGKVPKFCCPAEGLRILHQMESGGAAMLRRAAEEMPDYAPDFLRIAREKACRAEKLLCLLQQYV